MENIKLWGDKPYLSLNYHLREKFSCKVFKISIDGGFTCPNRDGKVATGGCVFCSERGSGDYAGDRLDTIKDQFYSVKKAMNNKWSKGKYIMYFQAYTNTYAPVDILREKFETALSLDDDIVGIAIATRPDCLNDDVLDLLSELSKKTYLWVELGLQTIRDDTAKIINRGYELQVFDEAVKRLRDKKIEVVTHVIIGLPGETLDDSINTVEYLNSKDIQGIKFHLLYIIKDTKLYDMYNEKKFHIPTKEEYVHGITSLISKLKPGIVVHRITGDAPRDTIFEPQWSLKKWEVLNAINDEMKEKGIFQGLEYHTNLE